MPENLTPTTEGIRWFATAIRLDWGDIDGRSLKAALLEYVKWMDSVDKEMPTALVRAKAHDLLGVCLFSDGESVWGEWEGSHWGDAELCLVCKVGAR